jgi:hypothetical protein
MKQTLLSLLLMTGLYGSVTEYIQPVNKLQLCATYEASFLTSAELYEDTKSCHDLMYSILSFKQMVIVGCDIDKDDVPIAWYVNKQIKENCENK